MNLHLHIAQIYTSDQQLLQLCLVSKNKNNKHALWNLSKERSALSGVPKFFYDLMELLNKNIKVNSDKNEFLEEILLNINRVLAGELDISDSGEIYFKDVFSSKNINLNVF